MGIAILCSGGDAAGMNPAIKKFVDFSYEQGLSPYLIYDGLEGLIDGKIKKATYKDVAGIIHLGGTIIRSSRSKRFYESNYRAQAYNNLLQYDIDRIIVLGGDGSFRAMSVFCSEYNIGFVGIPSTIDNDIYATEYALGVDTALNVIRDAIDKIKDTASSFNRAFVVEVMGRESGYLAAVSAAISGAEICVIPEVRFEQEKIEKKLLEEIAKGRNYLLAIVAEGADKTQFVKEWIEERFALETRVSVLGHIQRGGNPTVYDRLMAFEFVIKAIEKLSNEPKTQMMIGYQKGQFVFVDIFEVVSNKNKLAHHIIENLNYLG